MLIIGPDRTVPSFLLFVFHITAPTFPIKKERNPNEVQEKHWVHWHMMSHDAIDSLRITKIVTVGKQAQPFYFLLLPIAMYKVQQS